MVGSFDILGDPVGLLSNLSTGVTDFFYEPIEGLKPDGKGFLYGLGKGGTSLVSNTMQVCNEDAKFLLFLFFACERSGVVWALRVFFFFWWSQEGLHPRSKHSVDTAYLMWFSSGLKTAQVHED